MSTQKQLTIVISEFHSREELSECLASMCDIDERLEVLLICEQPLQEITDAAKTWQQRYPNDVRAVVPHAAERSITMEQILQEATGRYYKIVGASDRILTQNLPAVLDKLEQTDADVVIMGFETEQGADGTTKTFLPDESCFDRRIDIIKLAEKYDELSDCLNFPSVCYHTDFLRQTGLAKSRKTSREDLKYSILPYVHAKSIFLIPDVFYQYRIKEPDAEKTIADRAQTEQDHLTALQHMIDYYAASRPLGKARDEFVRRKLQEVIISHYVLLLVQNPDKEEGRKRAKVFHDYLQGKVPNLCKDTEKKYKQLRQASHIRRTEKFFQNWYQSGKYEVF